MRVAVTGTPGTGKTSATDLLETDLDVVHLNEVITDEELTTGRDDDRDTLVADIEATGEWLSGRENVLFESHLAHHFDADRVIVLRCHPDDLGPRLSARGEPESTLAENAESEALDVILGEAVDRHDANRIYEIDTTERSVEEVAEEIKSVLEGRREPGVGTVSFVDYL